MSMPKLVNMVLIIQSRSFSKRNGSTLGHNYYNDVILQVFGIENKIDDSLQRDCSDYVLWRCDTQ